MMGETRRLRLLVSYDGQHFAGWQSQKHGNTIQDHLERSLAKICGHKVVMTGAGRTDAGVHAIGQCAHADVPANVRTQVDWLNALNGTLPRTIRISRARFVPKTFHARFSARAKLYRYRIVNSAILSPFELGRAWHVARPLDVTLLKKGAEFFVGRHDFAAFAANRGKRETDTVRTIASVRIARRADVIAIEIWGDGFLYKMMRMMTGALVRCALGKEPLEGIASRLDRTSSVLPGSARVPPAGLGVPPKQPSFSSNEPGKIRHGETSSPRHGAGAVAELRKAQPVLVAPAEGLYLVRVRY